MHRKSFGLLYSDRQLGNQVKSEQLRSPSVFKPETWVRKEQKPEGEPQMRDPSLWDEKTFTQCHREHQHQQNTCTEICSGVL